MSEDGGSKKHLVGGAAAACAVCCAPPVLALIGLAGAGTLATAATFAFAGLVFGFVVAAASLAAFVVRKRRRDRDFGLPPSRHDSRALPDPVRRSSTG
jgi:hypothetical protein